MKTKPFQPNYDSPYNVAMKSGDYCCLCFRSIKNKAPKVIHVIAGGDLILHPDSEAEYVPDGGDIGALSIGNDCARKVGLEWTHEGGEKCN